MKSTRYLALIVSLLLVLFLIGLNQPFGQLPALGTLLNPSSGVWNNAELGASPSSFQIKHASLKQPVRIVFDEQFSPHIFAETAYDLYFAQGWVIARDRLFQLEIQTYDASGRLSELLGERTLSRDQQTRKMGMVQAAQLAHEEMQKDPETALAIQAYSDGINAWIEDLSPRDYPIEYKLLGIAPEPWSPIKSAYLLKNMSRMLSGWGQDIRNSTTEAYFGKEYLERFLWQPIPDVRPTIPKGTPFPPPVELPKAPDSIFVPSLTSHITPFNPHPNNGSNNWAVSGSKTKSGYPILANDPHLSMTLPSIWYQMQLSSPEVNVYGVTIPGAPGIIIGFNESIAWGVTNVGTDVYDILEITFKDDTKEEYLFDGQWLPTTKEIDTIFVKNRDLFVDTLVFTHHGPVQTVFTADDSLKSDPIYHALRWTAHEPSNELRAFLKLNKAENYSDYTEALTHFHSPAQNFAFADKHGDIALWVNGRLPLRWEGQGARIGDGSRSSYDWKGWIPRTHLPHILNPKRGYVSSANQFPVNPEEYPYYLSDSFSIYERGKRINDLLDHSIEITKDTFQNIQADSYSLQAEKILPLLLNVIDSQQEHSPLASNALSLLKRWDYTLVKSGIAPSLYATWIQKISQEIFEDELEEIDANIRRPAYAKLVDILLNEESFRFYDDISTKDIIETRDMIIQRSYYSMLTSLKDRFGDDLNEWKWARVNPTQLQHIGYIPGFESTSLATDGDAETINAINYNHGPSWRMIVELGETPKAWGILPGGASGNPASFQYDRFVEDWAQNKLYPLPFFLKPPQDSFFEITLTGDSQ